MSPWFASLFLTENNCWWFQNFWASESTRGSSQRAGKTAWVTSSSAAACWVYSSSAWYVPHLVGTDHRSHHPFARWASRSCTTEKIQNCPSLRVFSSGTVMVLGSSLNLLFSFYPYWKTHEFGFRHIILFLQYNNSLRSDWRVVATLCVLVAYCTYKKWVAQESPRLFQQYSLGVSHISGWLWFALASIHSRVTFKILVSFFSFRYVTRGDFSDVYSQAPKFTSSDVNSCSGVDGRVSGGCRG